MKIYTSKYRNHWISPYTILEKLLFWKDWENIDYDTPWVEKWANRLQPFCQALNKFLDLIHPRIEYVKIDYWDTWSMDTTLAPIVLPMLKQLKATKHGSCQVDLEDVPEELRTTSFQQYDGQKIFEFYDSGETDEWYNGVHRRWDWVMDEMIWAFEQLCDDDHERQFWKVHPEIDFKKYPEDEGKEVVPVRWSVEGQCDWDGLKKHNERIDNGLRLFGKYFRGLWD